MQPADCQGILIQYDIDVYAHEVIDNTSSVRLYIHFEANGYQGPLLGFPGFDYNYYRRSGVGFVDVVDTTM